MSGYKQQYLSIKYDYDTYCFMDKSTLNNLITALDQKVQVYEQASVNPLSMYDKNKIYNDGDMVSYGGDIFKKIPAAIEGKSVVLGGDFNVKWQEVGRDPYDGTKVDPILLRDVSNAFLPLSQYYANLLSIKQRLNDFLDGASDEVVDGQDRLVNEERYAERVHPETTVKPREVFFGLMNQLRPSTIPVVLSAGVFMACVSLLMIFQMSGFTGQINIPPALSSLPEQLKHGIGPEPAHKNPVVLGGAVVLLGVAVVALTVLYFRSNQMSK